MRILVTGAAGLIGGETCARLAARGHDVTALVHRERGVRGNDRRPVDGVTILPGDVTRPGLGLAAAPDFDLVIHSAAITAFDAPADLYDRVNVAGTAHVAALGLPLLHVSTAYVCGTRDGVVSEDSTGTEFVNGYEASKAAGEAIVRAAGVPFAIARPSVVVGASDSGEISRFENIYMIFKLIAEGRVRTLPGAASASLDLVPIDHVCGGIVAMAENFAGVAGKTLHLVGASPVPLTLIGEAIAAVPGLGAPHFVDPADFAPARLPPTERRYHAAAAALYTSYLLRGPVFDTANAAALVPPCPPTGRAWLDRLIGYCVEQGFVTSRRGRGSQAISA
ncbi:MAG: SDR family oxidoreductase [Sandarakinorhabdus sp.]|nr:SDR family oxidoreductase [Sandarakinorhabdus sp.]